jgi:AbrB family looped-hinge helix DNA binding protein
MGDYEIRPGRASRAREAAPQYGAASDRPLAVAVTVAERGRLVLPADVRARLRIRDGDRLVLMVDADGTIRLQTAEVVARSLLGAFKHLSPERRAVDELIDERRREAAMEERDTRDLAAPPRRRKGGK